jgi:hypothetical protein
MQISNQNQIETTWKSPDQDDDREMIGLKKYQVRDPGP